jgi:hypothetical protein
MRSPNPFPRPLPGRGAAGLLAATLVLAVSCETSDPVSPDTDLGVFRVVEIVTTSHNPDYPRRPPGEPPGGPVCQIQVDVWFVLPDACSGFGGLRDLGLDGDTWRFQVQGYRSPSRGDCGGRVAQPMGFCLPGLGLDPPPRALPAGHYVMIVNGFEGGFDIP